MPWENPSNDYWATQTSASNWAVASPHYSMQTAQAWEGTWDSVILPLLLGPISPSPTHLLPILPIPTCSKSSLPYSTCCTCTCRLPHVHWWGPRPLVHWWDAGRLISLHWYKALYGCLVAVHQHNPHSAGAKSGEDRTISNVQTGSKSIHSQVVQPYLFWNTNNYLSLLFLEGMLSLPC